MGNPLRIVSQLNPIVISGNVTLSGGIAASITGNTDGVPAVLSSGTMYLAGGNNITLSQNGQSITISAPNLAGGAADGLNRLAAGTQTAGTLATVNFANSNGITFGMSNSSQITASHNGITLQTTQPVAYSAANGSANFSTLTFADSNGVSFSTGTQGVFATVKTDYQTSGNYLTTARQSNDAIGLNTAKTNVTWTVNSNGLSLDAGAYLTTAAQSDHSHGNPTLALTNLSGTTASNSNGLTLSLSAANPGGGAGDGFNIIAAGGSTANTTGTIVFSNSNGVSFGLNGDTVTATVKTDYLTTARQSNDAIGLNTALTAGPLAWTVNSSGLSLNAGSAAGTTSGFGGNLISGSMTHNTAGLNLSLNHPAWLTTAMQSNAATISNINISAGTTSTNASNFTFANGNGITFGLGTGASAGSITASHNGITTGRASNDGVGLNTAQSNVTWTVNSSGLSLDARGYAGTATGATNASVTANSNGISVSVGPYITTARASNDAIGLNTAKTNVTWTVNSSGLSLDASGYAGTGTSKTGGAALTLNSNGLQFNGASLAGTTTGFAGANISGSMTHNTDGLNLSLSVAAPGGGATPVASASNGSFSFTTLGFSNANNVTFGTSAGSIITASVAAPGAAAENNWVNLLGANTAGNTTASGSTIGYSGVNLTLSGTNGSVVNISAPATSSLSATGQVSISTNGSTISIGVPSAVTVSRYNEYKESPMVAGQIGNATLHIQPWLVPNIHMDRVVQHIQLSNTSNSSNSLTQSNWIGIYTRNDSTLSLLHSASTSFGFTASGTVGSYSQFGGIRALTMGLTQTLTEGMYWIGALSRTSANAAGQTLNQMLNSNVNSTYSGLIGEASNATKQWTLGLGGYTATTSAMPASIAFTQINGNSSIFLRPPSLYFVNGTV